MRKRSLVIVATIVLVLALATMVLAADPFVGTWKLNVAKSKATDPSAMPQSETFKAEALDNGQKTTVDGLDANGKTYHFEFSIKYDGKDYPVTGYPLADTFAQKKIDANTLELVAKKAGKEVERWRFIVSKDGKTETSTGKGMTEKGKAYNGTFVYDKQ